jgi:hypothetical protein
MKIISLGEKSIALAKKLSQYPEYNLKEIMEVGNQTPEEYETSASDFNMGVLCNDKDEELTFIVTGGSYISGMTLALMEKVKEKSLKVLYIKPNILNITDEVALKQDRATFHILQEFARSGLITDMSIISVGQLAHILGNMPIIGYTSKINDAIAYPYHMINVYTNTAPLMGNMSPVYKTARMSTFGTFDIEEKKDLLYFPIDNIREKRYYYAVPESILKEDGELLSTIQDNMKEQSNNGKIKTTYGIYSTDYERSYCFVQAFSSHIQPY